MDPKHTSIETITKGVGAWNTDIAAGWGVGLLGKERIAGRLYQRRAPEHLLEPQNAQRLIDWNAGHDAAIRYRKWALLREVHFVGENKDGQVLVVRKGWGVPRGQVITQLEKKGCAGDVRVFYFDGNKIVRTVNCGI